MSSFKHLYVVDSIPKNIFLLCQCLKPPYVMTFDVIPISFFTFLNGTKNNIDIGPGPQKKAGTTSTIFFDVNISWGQNCRRC
jgi:hypothetical protein